MKVRFMYALTFISASFLSGCAGMNSSFDCPMKPGVMCKSLDQVNTMVDQGQLGSNASKGCPNCQTLSMKNNRRDFNTPYPQMALNPGDPLRYGETVMRIWLAPYEDKAGNYYQTSLFYTVVKPGHWIGSPVKAISDEGENV